MKKKAPSTSPDDSQFSIKCISATIATLLIFSIIATTPVAIAQDDTESVVVQQGNQCVQIQALGDGTQSVQDFYDYRSTITSPEGLYSSYGTQDIQLNQVSQLFVYNGINGTSLVFLHDKLGAEEGGFVASADISGLPTNGSWAVRDDYYDERQDDVFNTNLSNGQEAHIEWLSNNNRTDGAAFLGLESAGYENITIDMAFNEQSDNYPFIKWQGPPEENEIVRWIARSGTGETTALIMNQSVQISPEACPESSQSFSGSENGGNNTNSTEGTTTEAGGLFGNNSSSDFEVTDEEGSGELFSNSTETTTSTTAVPPTPTPTPTTSATPTPTATTTTTTTPTATLTEVRTTTLETTPTGEVTETTGETGQGDSGGSFALGPGFGVMLTLLAIVILGLLGIARQNQ